MRASRVVAVVTMAIGGLLATAPSADAGPPPKPDDRCSNLPGVQSDVPPGYRVHKGECFPRGPRTAGEFKGFTSYVFGGGCAFAAQTLDAGFGRFSPYGSGGVHVEGCAEFGATTGFLDFVGTFTVTTSFGPISGTATGLVAQGTGAAGDPMPFDLLLTPTAPGSAIRMVGIWHFGGTVPATNDRIDGSLTLE